MPRTEPGILDELDKYRQMRRPMPDIGRAMEEAARQLGLLDLVDQPEPNPWMAQNSMNMEGEYERWRPRFDREYRNYNPGNEWWETPMGDTGGSALPSDEPIYPGDLYPLDDRDYTYPEHWDEWSPSMNFSYYKPVGLGNPSSQWALNMESIDYPMNQGWADRLSREGGYQPQPGPDLQIPGMPEGWEHVRHLPGEVWFPPGHPWLEENDEEPDLIPWEGSFEPNINMTNVSSSLMDLLQTPGFKIGLGGTAALLAVLQYLGVNALEEISP